MVVSEIKKAARQRLKGKWQASMVVYLIRLGIVTICLWLFRSFKNQALGMLVSFLIPSPISIGLYSFYLSVARNIRSRDIQIFEFFMFFWNSVKLVFFRWFKIFIYNIFLIVPGVITRYNYSMAYFIFVDNPGISAKEALKRSKALMKGQKYKLFLLELNNIHWLILSIISFGLFFPFFKAYSCVARAIFYDEIKKIR